MELKPHSTFMSARPTSCSLTGVMTSPDQLSHMQYALQLPSRCLQQSVAIAVVSTHYARGAKVAARDSTRDTGSSHCRWRWRKPEFQGPTNGISTEVFPGEAALATSTGLCQIDNVLYRTRPQSLRTMSLLSPEMSGMPRAARGKSPVRLTSEPE